jgi:DNA replication protein DnaC
MEHDPLIAMLNRLKLTAIRDQLDSLVDEAAQRDLTIREALSLFCEREISRKDERRIEMSVGLARFPFVRDLDGFDFAAQPSIDKKQIRELTGGRFIANAEAVLLLGPPRRRQDASGGGDWTPGDPGRLYRAVRFGADLGGPACQGS